MYQQEMLGLDEARVAVDAVLDEATSRGLTIAVAVTDGNGVLVAYAAQDGVYLNSRTLCVRKAFSAAYGRSSTREVRAKVEASVGVPVELHHGTQGTSAQGGVAIDLRGKILGGVGVSGGNSAPADEELATIGVQAIIAAIG